MAVTAIWPIKGRIDGVINYARNPEKTTDKAMADVMAMHTVNKVVEYTADQMKTEERKYVTAINCSEETAAAEFMNTKILWGKTDGAFCWVRAAAHCFSPPAQPPNETAAKHLRGLLQTAVPFLY